MNEICKDPKFGEMTYNHRWQKIESIRMFDKEWEITVAAKAYSNKAITAEQQMGYEAFKRYEEKNIEKATCKIAEYVDSLTDEFISGEITINSNDDLAKVVTPKTLLFKQDGTTIMLFDCVWDREHGIGINLVTLEIGSQDLFL